MKDASAPAFIPWRRIGLLIGRKNRSSKACPNRASNRARNRRRASARRQRKEDSHFRTDENIAGMTRGLRRREKTALSHKSAASRSQSQTRLKSLALPCRARTSLPAQARSENRNVDKR